MAPQTMFEKIWNRHVVAEEQGELLLYVDRALTRKYSFTAESPSRYLSSRW